MVKLGASNCRIDTHKDNTDLSASPQALPEKLGIGKRACMNPRLLKNQKLGVRSTLRNRTRSSVSGFLIPILHTNYK